MSLIYHLWWNESVKPKARPRVTCNGTYMPVDYTEMKAKASACLLQQWTDLGKSSPIEYKVRVYMFFVGKHSRSSDYVDNVPGTIYDAMVAVGIILNDNGLHAPGGIHDLEHYTTLRPRLDILIAPWLPFADSLEQFAEVCDWLKAQRSIELVLS